MTDDARRAGASRQAAQIMTGRAVARSVVAVFMASSSYEDAGQVVHVSDTQLLRQPTPGYSVRGTHCWSAPNRPRGRLASPGAGGRHAAVRRQVVTRPV